MKKILSNNITSTAAQPFKQGTWIHLQDGIAEALLALALQQIGPAYDATKVYILHGCVNSTVPPIYTVTAGAILYGGEIYLVPAFSFTAADTAIGTVTIDYFAGANADPVEFTDGINHNVHVIRTVVVTDDATVGALDFDNWLRAGLEDEIKLNIAGGAAPAFNTGWFAGGGSGLYFRRDGNRVSIYGNFANSAGIPTGPSTIFTLPVGYRPTKQVVAETIVTTRGDSCLVIPKTNGNVDILNMMPTPSVLSAGTNMVMTFFID